MQFKHSLPHIYITIIKFDLSNYQMFLWFSGIAQGIVIKRREFEEPLLFFFQTGHYESDVLFFVVVFFLHLSKVLTLNLKKKY